MIEDDQRSKRQLHMIWSGNRDGLEPPLPRGYLLRTYRAGDEPGFYRVMASAGWPGWDDRKLEPWAKRTLPGGWFMIIHEGSGSLVASAMALRDCSEFGATGGELGWLACDSAHRGHGLGLVVSAAVTARFLAEGYRYVHLYTEDERSAALKTYFKLGYLPLLETPQMKGRWREVCARIRWPFEPERWPISPGPE